MSLQINRHIIGFADAGTSPRAPEIFRLKGCPVGYKKRKRGEASKGSTHRYSHSLQRSGCVSAEPYPPSEQNQFSMFPGFVVRSLHEAFKTTGD